MAKNTRLKKLIYLSKAGIVTCVGCGMEENANAIFEGKSKLKQNSDFTKTPFFLGKVEEQLPYFKLKEPFITRTNAILLKAIEQIEDEIKSAIEKYGKSRVGVVLGTTTSGIEENYEAFKHLAKSGVWDASLYKNEKNAICNPSNFLADYFGLGLNYTVSTACTSGVKAIIKAKRLIEEGICDAVICGGVDSLNTLTINGFNSLSLLSQNISNPFSKNRDGINIGEAAAVFVACKDKISDIYIAGHASNNDAFHITKPEPSASKAKEAIVKALEMAGLSSVDYVNLHATGTSANDEMEANAFFETLKDSWASSIKPIVGHTLGAAGAVEVAICHFLMQDGNTKLPPHIFDGMLDENIKPLKLVPKALDLGHAVNSTLSSSFAFGGDNAIMILRRVDGL